MAKITVVDIYSRIAANQSELATGQITVKQCRDRIARLAKTALTLGLQIVVPSTEELRRIAPKVIETVPTSVPATTDTNDYESSEEDDNYEESYESSNCW